VSFCGILHHIIPVLSIDSLDKFPEAGKGVLACHGGPCHL